MLRTPTPFPQVGSYALIEVDGCFNLARIQKPAGDGEVLISLPLLPDVASGNRRVAMEALVDGTPLSAEEERELDRLLTDLAGDGRDLSRRGRAARAQRQARVEALRDRQIHAPILAEMRRRLPDPQVRASRRAA